MKRAISILLILSIAGGTMHIDELVKVPFIITHFFEHKKTNPCISFFGFLNNHYVNPKKAESARDEKSNAQLPFKSNQVMHSHFSAIIFKKTITNIFFERRILHFSSVSISKALSLYFDIWQPPKI